MTATIATPLLLLATLVAVTLTSAPRYANVTTLFSQGLLSPRSQGAKYSKAGMVVDGDRHVTYPGANDIVHNLVDYPELRHVGYEWCFNPLYILMQVLTYLRTLYFWSIGETAHHVYVSLIDIAGPMEVAEHAEAWRTYNWELDVAASHGGPHRNRLVLFGTSRGAATTFTSVAISTAWERRHLRLVVLEAPFDTVEHALQHQLGNDVASLVYNNVVKQYTNFSETYLSPARAAWRFPLDVPVAFVTSDQDAVVHPNQTKYMIDILRTRQHPNVHHLQLRESAHHAMSLGDGEDQRRYVQFMAEMHERYVLPPESSCSAGGRPQ